MHCVVLVLREDCGTDDVERVALHRVFKRSRRLPPAIYIEYERRHRYQSHQHSTELYNRVSPAQYSRSNILHGAQTQTLVARLQLPCLRCDIDHQHRLEQRLAPLLLRAIEACRASVSQGDVGIPHIRRGCGAISFYGGHEQSDEKEAQG